ncbi:MAG: 50S ribosomal protein L29 [Patescibacteria group bacterium]|nr:50S ribosomal protein L29 [Patescibacteria group bacterium]MDE2144672.1 50S ribosomal protein L29 [Patescibacteria group bacterium]
MKKSDIQKLKEKTVSDLEKELVSTREKIAEFRISIYRGKQNVIKDFREARKKFARILTFINQNKNAGK